MAFSNLRNKICPISNLKIKRGQSHISIIVSISNLKNKFDQISKIKFAQSHISTIMLFSELLINIDVLVFTEDQLAEEMQNNQKVNSVVQKHTCALPVVFTEI